MHRRGYPPNADPSLIEAHQSLDWAAYELGAYTDRRAAPIEEVLGALDLALWALAQEIEAWREPPPLRPLWQS